MRTSRKQVERICDVMSTDKLHYRLVYNQMLGNRKNYYYNYSIVTDIPKYTDYVITNIKPLKYEKVTRDYITGYVYDKTILKNVSLKEAYNFMKNILENSLKEN